MTPKTVDESEKPIRFLIVDPNDNFWADLHEGFKEARKTVATAPAPAFADTVRASQTKLSDRDFVYAAIFVNPSLGTPAWTAVVRAAHQYRAGTPIFMIYDKKPSISGKDAQKMGLTGALAKPFDYQKLLKLVSMDTEEAPLPDNNEQAAAPPPPPAPVSTVDDDYAIVQLTGVVGKMNSSFDLFARLSNGKYVRILNAGDSLSRHRIEGYLSKGMDKLYVLKTAQADYLKFFDELTAQVLKDDTVTADVKAASVAGQGQSMLSFMKNSGFSEASLETAHKYVNNTTEVVNQLAASSDAVKKLLDDALAYEHSVACTTFAGLMLKQIGGQNPAIFSAIGIACFLHDIALIGKSPALLEENEANMTPEEIAIFHAHPDEGAKLVKKMKGVPPIAMTAIAQHHLRMGKKGFPEAKRVAEPNKIAELIGLSEEFLKCVRLSKLDPKVDPFAVLSERAANEFSGQLVEAFIRTLKEK